MIILLPERKRALNNAHSVSWTEDTAMILSRKKHRLLAELYAGVDVYSHLSYLTFSAVHLENF